MFKYFFIALLLTTFLDLKAEIILHKKDATVWGQTQNIKGELVGFIAENGTLYLNHVPIQFQISGNDGSFEVPITLGEGLNTVYVAIDSSGNPITSDTLMLTLGYKLKPEIFAFATISGNKVRLHSQVIENPDSTSLSYSWEAEEMNPSTITIATPHDSATNIALADDASLGEYYFNLTVVAANGDTVTARTYVTLDSTGVHPFQIKTDYASWIDRAIIYEITPCSFVMAGRFTDITEKIPELAQLGINAIWLQPIFQTPDIGGMGYGITNYFKIRAELGSESELHNLIETAHTYNIKVLLDIVTNHTFIKHPYAQDSDLYGTDSHYYDFYQRDATKDPHVPYSRFYNKELGFVNYFWRELPNLNYDNPEVQRWMTEACKYWIEKFDIDGYRFDAIWGVTARKPEYTKKLRLALKRIKPEILMLAEDKASWPNVFDERFDVAFDWAPEESWVSHWFWQVDWNDWYVDRTRTIFNFIGQNERSNWLRDALTNYGNGFHPNAKILRFMENNDLHRFIRHHGLARTKMVAAMMFALHGIPLIYNGQEIGFDKTHPYATSYIFEKGRTIESQDTEGLYPYYQHLIHLRKTYSSLTSNNFQEIVVEPSNSVFAFQRWQEKENIFVIMNMGDAAVTATMNLPLSQLRLDSTQTYYLTELLNGSVIAMNPENLSSVDLSMNKHTTHIYLLADTVATVDVRSTPIAYAPQALNVQNFPNPFNPSTSITFTVPQNGHVKLTVFDILGREVQTLLDEFKQKGEYNLLFNGENLSSGVYFYKLELEKQHLVKKMMLVR